MFVGIDMRALRREDNSRLIDSDSKMRVDVLLAALETCHHLLLTLCISFSFTTIILATRPTKRPTVPQFLTCAFENKGVALFLMVLSIRYGE